MVEKPVKVTFRANDPNTASLSLIAKLLGVDIEVASSTPAMPSCLVLQGADFEELRPMLEGSPHFVFVYDLGSSPTLAAEFGLQRKPARTLAVTRVEPAVTGPLSGLTLPVSSESPTMKLDDRWKSLIEADGNPVFAMSGRCFVTSHATVPDLSLSATPGHEPFRDHFAELFPLLMFLRHALDNHCWQAEEACATLIIDDPLLRSRYGCIKFDPLLRELNSHDVAATFAFIPWNFSRTDPQVAEQFRKSPDRLSICVHGCDHTKAEFTETDSGRLDAMLATAMIRMRKHESDYQIPFDPIMVFPQGRFSRESLDALERTGFSAAVNTTAFPVNYSGDLTSSAMLDLAPVYPSGLAVWRRRYPVDVFNFACDMFLQRPVIVVQHHHDFARGFSPFAAFVDQIRALNPRLKWRPLGQTLAKSTWRRRDADGKVQTRSMLAEQRDVPIARMATYSPHKRASISIRRHLSEFRDQYVHRWKFGRGF